MNTYYVMYFNLLTREPKVAEHKGVHITFIKGELIVYSKFSTYSCIKEATYSHNEVYSYTMRKHAAEFWLEAQLARYKGEDLIKLW